MEQARTLPPVDALMLACATIADANSGSNAHVTSHEQTVEIHWVAFAAHTVHPPRIPHPVDLPASYFTDARVQVFACGTVS